MPQPTLCLDFDGVLHWYRNGWTAADVVDDIPVPGAQEFVRKAQEHFRVVVHSSRCSQEGGTAAVIAWLRKHGFPALEVVAEKPAAFVSIDDRAICFTGEWPNVEDLLAFVPWYRRASDGGAKP